MRNMILMALILAVLLFNGCGKETKMSDIHTNFIALSKSPSFDNWCGDGTRLTLSQMTNADTIGHSSGYAAIFWIWLAKLPEDINIEAGVVYKVTYNILGTCRTDGGKAVLVNLLTLEEAIKPYTIIKPE